jgi:hypothetical protein
MFRTQGVIFRKTAVSKALFCLLVCLYRFMYNKPYHNCIHNRLPEDEPLDSKHVDIKKLKMKILILEICISLVYIV